MLRESFQGFLNWISGGALTAALALLVFVPTLNNGDKIFQNIALGFFIVAIPFLCCSLALYKEMKWRESSTEPSDNKLAMLSLVGCLSIFIGLSFLCLALHVVFCGVFILSALIATQVYKMGSSSLGGL